MPDYATLFRALTFAAQQHRLQRRQDAEGTPYINHPIAVAGVLAVEGGVTDENMLVAALLHDTVEDTGATFDQLEALFGPAVRALVAELTDDKSLPKQTRKELQVEHALHATPQAKQCKLADKICNVRDLAATPPVDWSLERKRQYLDWSARVVAGCRGVNPRLEAAYDLALATARAALERA